MIKKSIGKMILQEIKKVRSILFAALLYLLPLWDLLIKK